MLEKHQQRQVLLCLAAGAALLLPSAALADPDDRSRHRGQRQEHERSRGHGHGDRDRWQHRDRDRGHRDWSRGHHDRDRWKHRDWGRDHRDWNRGHRHGPHCKHRSYSYRSYPPRHYGDYRPRPSRVWSIPRLLHQQLRAELARFLWGQVWHSGHRHNHAVYGFPVYRDHRVQTVPYAYCEDQYYGDGVFVDGQPRF